MTDSDEKRWKKVTLEILQVKGDGLVQIYNSIADESKRIKKGDDVTVPVHGDKVALTYTGTFAAGVTHDGQDWAGRLFDSTLNHGSQPKKGPKVHKPLAFVLGQGKAIRGWEECVKTMTLGEKVEVTIGPKWAYRKGGLSHPDTGKYIVPPNATLC